MGMDVYGREPISETGTYFRNNVWWWRPLWNYCITQHPDLTEQVVDGQSNSGDGLDAKNAFALGKRLQEDIDSGVVAQYEKEYREYIEALPMNDCEYCQATGHRVWEANSINNNTNEPFTTICNACNGEGKVEDYAANYPFSVQNVQEFSKFLVSSGGFNIW
jgi:hypothetical protein